jgi:tetratricopeptide (TPR) repeat protein
MVQPAPDREAFKLMRAGRLAEALTFAEQAVAGASACLPAHGLLASILLQLGRAEDAKAVVSRALQHTTGVADAYDALAYVSLHLRDHERSNALYRRATEFEPGTPRFWYNLASSERSFGRLNEAEAACDRAIALDGTQYPSYLLRSELRVQTAETNHVGELQRLLARTGLEDRARFFLGYALAKELDDLRRFDEAFRWFTEAATTRRRHLAYDVAVDERKLQRIVAVFPGQHAVQARASEDSGRFIFIVGLPRSGTTLVERILTGLAGVVSNGETDNFSRALLSATPQGATDVFARAAAADPTVVANNYIQLARVGLPGNNTASDSKIIEKLPMNYLYLGAIHRALPHARLLVLKRSPLDTCFAMYRTLFGEAYPFSYDFEELARYYAAYARLMAHWRATLGPHLHEIVYEDLVKEPLRIGAAIAGACDLNWTDTAIEVHKNAAVSLTASAAQVRRPIYGSSSGRWRHYRTQLEPLIRALRQQGVTLSEDV